MENLTKDKENKNQTLLRTILSCQLMYRHTTKDLSKTKKKLTKAIQKNP